ncbi:response regulator [Hyalangium rubrum]|uniref:Response regulatory domain-containing protein n=1 Tax=Hyalangium rubrum TaxID=3103134 RepID=A0ABU5H7D6_9BACT|nr:hypothetical protein [Hyalangium sp. s54d21]MDY7229171.1 hypothetical protein [Hyalangium sp. s54d21]
MSERTRKKRILVIDDSESIHRDFRRVLSPEHMGSQEELSELEEALFGLTVSAAEASEPVFEVDSAFQGQEGLAMARAAMAEGRPYALVFLDYLMPPGWSGVETLRELRKVLPEQAVVICSAYSEYSWEDLIREFGDGPNLTELRKPFHHQELYQLTVRLTGFSR